MGRFDTPPDRSTHARVLQTRSVLSHLSSGPCGRLPSWWRAFLRLLNFVANFVASISQDSSSSSHSQIDTPSDSGLPTRPSLSSILLDPFPDQTFATATPSSSESSRPELPEHSKSPMRASSTLTATWRTHSIDDWIISFNTRTN